jgi:hypothetical protein
VILAPLVKPFQKTPAYHTIDLIIPPSLATGAATFVLAGCDARLCQ